MPSGRKVELDGLVTSEDLMSHPSTGWRRGPCYKKVRRKRSHSFIHSFETRTHNFSKLGHFSVNVKMMFLIFCVALFTTSTADTCAKCDVSHPQHHYCIADFAMKLRVQSVSQASLSDNLVTAEVLTSWKKGPSRGVFQFLVGVFCGRSFERNRIYAVTGLEKINSDGSKYWRHESCNFAELWEDMADQQKIGFRKEYKQYCTICSIHPTSIRHAVTVDELENDYPQAFTFWTPTNCYYNPHMSIVYTQLSKGRVEDCEDEYGLCASDESGQCSWQLTEEYEECFKLRDDFVIVSTGQFAITDPSQCDALPTRRKRRNCRRRFKEEMEADKVLRI